jgi:EmrB/QacA subfamily drug resistance transporter
VLYPADNRLPVAATGNRKSATWALAATILGSAMAFIDGTVINVAMPVLQSDLHARITETQWIADAYLLVLSSLILVGGSLGDRLGRVRVFAIGVAIFTAASVWCGLAGGAGMLIAARAVQGAGAALLVPGSLAIIAEVYPENERGRAIGTWSAMTALAIIAGPILGGALVQMISWRAVFFINVPFAAVVLWIVWRRMQHRRADSGEPIDWLGALLITGALAAITFALIEAPSRRTSQLAWIGGAGVVCLIVFVVVEMRSKHPLVPLKLFRSRTFTGANALTLLLYAALGGAMFLLPFNFIQIRHYTPFEAGLAFLPIVATMSLLSRWTGALADRLGPRPLLIVGPIVAACGFAALALSRGGSSYWTTFFPGLLTLGAGMAITVAPLTTTVMTSINDERHAGAASGINNAIARAAGLLAVAVFGAVAVFIFSRELDRQLASRGASAELRRAMAAQTLRLADAKPPAGADANTVNAAIAAAFLRAFRFNMLVAAGLAAASAAGALMITSTSSTPRSAPGSRASASPAD